MVDPLGLIGAQQAGGQGAPKRATPADPNAPSFKDVLMNEVDRVNELQRDSEQAITDLMTGERSDLEGVLLATEKADTAFRTLLAVRNKVMDAYNEIQQMRV